MTQNLNFDLEIDLIVESGLKEITKEIQADVIPITPVDEWLLVENIDISEIEHFNWWISQKVFTDLDKVPHAWIVEWWVEWKTYTYHINWIAFKEWVWAQMYEEIFRNYQQILWSLNN